MLRFIIKLNVILLVVFNFQWIIKLINFQGQHYFHYFIKVIYNPMIIFSQTLKVFSFRLIKFLIILPIRDLQNVILTDVNLIINIMIIIEGVNFLLIAFIFVIPVQTNFIKCLIRLIEQLNADYQLLSRHIVSMKIVNLFKAIYEH